LFFLHYCVMGYLIIIDISECFHSLGNEGIL
jgi:hypothetical protein